MLLLLGLAVMGVLGSPEAIDTLKLLLRPPLSPAPPMPAILTMGDGAGGGGSGHAYIEIGIA